MRLALTVGLSAMTTCWIYVWCVLIGLWAKPADPRALLSPGSVLALLLISAAAMHLVTGRVRSRRRTQIILSGLGLSAVALAVVVDQQVSLLGLFTALAIAIGQPTPPALAFGLALLLWWRGAHIGAQTPTFSDIESSFRWGIGWLAAFGLILGLTTRPSLLPSLEADTTPFVVGFFFVSLVTLAIARLESLRTRTRALALNGQWLATLIAVAAAVVLVALIISQLLSFDQLRETLQPVFDLLGTVVVLLIYAIVIPLAYVIEFLAYLLLQVLHPDLSQTPPQPLQPSDINEMLRRLFGGVLPPEFLDVAKAAGAALVVAVVLLLAARTVSRWRPTAAGEDVVEEERESVWRPGALRRALLDLLRRVFARRRRADSAPAAASPWAPGPGAGREDRASVRALYRQLLRLGVGAGAARAPATTPYEHLPALAGSLEPRANLEELTDAYVRARYADETAPPEEVDRARRALDEVRTAAPARAPESARR